MKKILLFLVTGCIFCLGFDNQITDLHTNYCFAPKPMDTIPKIDYDSIKLFRIEVLVLYENSTDCNVSAHIDLENIIDCSSISDKIIHHRLSRWRF